MNEDESDGPCPVCAGPTRSSGTCHTYGGKPDGTGWLMCMGCWSALDIYCADDNCTWPGYTWGLNPRNPRSVENDKHRPEWLKGDWTA